MRVLIYGAGQLARMMALSAVPMGIEVQAVDVGSETVVDPISKLPAGMSLSQAIEEADVLSVEFEHVPEHLLEQAHVSGKLKPGIEAILTGADRVREKRLLERLGIANCAHRIVTDVEQLEEAVAALGERLILKASRDGYDGYGQWRLAQAADLAGLKTALAELDLNKVPLVVEQMADFSRELSLVGVRDAKGRCQFYPLAENLHYQGQLHVSLAPAPGITEALTTQAQQAFTALATELDYVGVLAVEFFQVDDRLLVNEIAPRVHNSGHWSMQGADTSQFENHIRAICGLPLGCTAALRPSAMINIIGCKEFSQQLLSIPECHLHWYGKSVRKKRKMGHINVSAESYAALGARLEKLSGYLPMEHFPKLVAEAQRLQSL
ncbi:5-(carboxyamino)imidazole ribonucleotide synthase [Aestuariibacter halophilus]|uniref:N5-carboxyaminoimidazole ribonucleotide synthase n=1 Tax=Fluctibacter halophilus TaxID=226011 RepID=A0ABS8GEM0_9ALTE|nr:5-(carboxyamino)imidazole ribonucleotide synthase [Aestuariibacter halophilus]MCC2618234.1 5-(carboxyamino)imidazole ribonucleotide synthase [Aestuariibacter halophilus]